MGRRKVNSSSGKSHVKTYQQFEMYYFISVASKFIFVLNSHLIFNYQQNYSRYHEKTYKQTTCKHISKMLSL